MSETVIYLARILDYIRINAQSLLPEDMIILAEGISETLMNEYDLMTYEMALKKYTDILNGDDNHD